MIRQLEVKGFRILRDFSWSLRSGVNVLVGANSAGKSTVLDAVELAIKGTLRGQRFGSSLSPDWFNAGMVNDFFNALATEASPILPEISIAITFENEPSLAKIQGCQGPHQAEVDAPGLWLRIYVHQEHMTEFLSEARSIIESDNTRALPVEYFRCEWKSFKGDSIVRRPDCVSCSRVDVHPEAYSRAIDSYAKSLIDTKLNDAQLRHVSSLFREVQGHIDNSILSEIVVSHDKTGGQIGLQIDKSPRTDWRNSIVLERSGLPFSVLGSADQVLTKCKIFFEKSCEESILLFEEPECHLSHTSLNELLSMVEESLGTRQQVIVTTHSPFVLNRLGVDRLSIVASGGDPKTIANLEPNTVRYFKKVSCCDTLRIALANKAVLVEGPTDEMVFSWAFRKMRGCMPAEKGIDVIEYGIRYKRALEFADAIGKEPLVALRDNDGKPENKWLTEVESYSSNHRVLIVGHDGEGNTIEPQMVQANRPNLDLLAEVTGSTAADDAGLEDYLLKHKVEWSLELLEADAEITQVLNAPRYIVEAIEFIDPVVEGAR